MGLSAREDTFFGGKKVRSRGLALVVLGGLVSSFSSCSKSSDPKRTPIPWEDHSEVQVIEVAPELPSPLQEEDWARVFDPDGQSGLSYALMIGASSETSDSDDPRQVRGDVAFTPASLTKMFTGAWALEKLGPLDRFETHVRFQPAISPAGEVRELELLGDGDPTWGEADFGETLTSRVKLLVRELKSRGVSRVVGPIQVTARDPRWVSPPRPKGYLPHDDHACYGAPIFALGVRQNCFSFSVRHSALSSRPVVSWAIPSSAVPVELEIDLQNEPRGLLVSQVQGGLRIRGEMKPESSFEVTRPHPDPARWVLQLLREELKREEMDGGLEVPANRSWSMRKSFTVSSPQMREILKSTLKRSINPFAQAVFLRLGQRTSLDLTPTLNELAEKGIREFLVELGVSDHERIKLFDGAGLSRENRVTARSLTQFLERLKERPEIFQQFVNTLAIAGVDGTLKNRLKGTAAQGRVFGKTGSLAGTHHLAGYVRNREGEYVPFVMLARESAGSTTDISQARPAMDRVLKRLAEILLQAD